MNRRRNRILVAYTLRGVVGLFVIVILGLLVCGCIYIYERIWSSEDVVAEMPKGNIITIESEVFRREEESEAFSVVLDAGHGGKDGGTYNGNIVEKDITLAVVQRMKKLLEAEGVSVFLTREEDNYVSLKDRVKEANRLTADLFVSIHCNYFEDDSTVNGVECYYCEGSEDGKYYAESIIDDLEAVGEIRTREAKEGDFYVLNKTNIPAVLLEIGFLSNPAECRKLASEEYQELLAKELVKSILDTAK